MPRYMYGHFADGYENEPYSVLDDLMLYVFHVHFKLFEMTEQGEYSGDYKGFLQYHHDHDYDGTVIVRTAYIPVSLEGVMERTVTI